MTFKSSQAAIAFINTIKPELNAGTIAIYGENGQEISYIGFAFPSKADCAFDHICFKPLNGGDTTEDHAPFIVGVEKFPEDHLTKDLPSEFHRIMRAGIK